SRSARALDREGDGPPRLPADGFARDRHLADDSVVRGAHVRSSRRQEIMRVVVTGASGFIGHNVLLRAPRDWEIVAVAHRTRGLDAFAAEHALSNVRVVACDLTDAGAVARLAAEVGRADAALYLAANGDPAASAERPRWDLESNTLALVTFLEHAAVDHLVYFSSGAVYDGLTGPVSPATPVAPRLPYAISKLAPEHSLR